MAASLERAGFDYILIEDTAMVEDTFGASAETTLRRGFMAPKNDPMPLVPLMTQRTRHIGIVPTVSTIQYHPYLAARLFTTLDHLTEGRVGMNVVTSVSDRVAQNYGFERHLDHDERYVMAHEWIEVVRRLQSSWEPDAVLADTANGVYADHRKVHPIDFAGKYYSSRGPLNTIPGPQGVPPIVSAGSSPPGRELAAAHVDTQMAMCRTVEDMKAYRIDVHRRTVAHGRKPDDIKLLFLATPVIAATDGATPPSSTTSGTCPTSRAGVSTSGRSTSTYRSRRSTSRRATGSTRRWRTCSPAARARRCVRSPPPRSR
jgi:FMN-dependent oxidoreductase (nitrilotriacetate monooxygenase family)